MGVESVITGLFGLATAGISAVSAHHTQAANAAAQSELNEATMKFNREEAAKARDWQHTEGAFSRNFALYQQQAAQQFNAEQILAAREYDTRMANTAHQREIADLKAAGLNPILSATKGNNGAASPVSPVLASPVASSSGAPMGSTASVGGLQAPKKDNYMGAFANTALEGLRLSNDVKRAKADEIRAQAEAKNAQTNALREAQDAIESAARITKLDADTTLAMFKGITEKQLANKLYEETLKVIQEKADNHEVAMATRDKLRSDAAAFSAMCFSQAELNGIRGQLESAESPAKIRKLNSEADHLQEKIKEIKFDLSDPKTLAYRELWNKNPQGMSSGEFVVDQMSKLVHGSINVSTSYGEHHGTITRRKD